MILRPKVMVLVATKKMLQHVLRFLSACFAGCPSAIKIRCECSSGRWRRSQWWAIFIWYLGLTRNLEIITTHFLLFYFILFLFYNKITHPCCQKTKLNTIKLLGGAGLNGGAVNFGASSASRQVPANFHPLFFVFVIEHNR